MDEVRMKRSDVLALSAAIVTRQQDEQLGKAKSPTALAYKLARIRRSIEPEVEAMTEARQKMQRALADIAEAHALRDDTGQPVKGTGGGYMIDPARRAAHWMAADAEQAALEALLTEEVDVRVYRLPVALWEPAGLTAAQMDGLLPILDGEPKA